MLDTKWSWISQKQLQNLKISFEQNKESYLSDIQAQKKEIKSVMTLISILPVLGLIFFVIDIISNNKSILEVLSDNFLFTLAILLGYIWVFMLISWWLINSKKTKYNKKSLFEIFNDFVSLSLNSEKTNYNNNDFYELAYKWWILNWIPNDIKISSYNSWELEYESDNIFTQEHSWKGMRTVDNCYLWKITFPKKITDISLLAKENSTNTLKWISKRIVNSLYSALVLVWLYYILIVEKCERKIIWDGCKNEIDLLWFLHPTYFSYVAIIAVIIFTFGYVKTLYKKGNIKNSTLDDKLDIFSGTNISELWDREQEIFKIIIQSSLSQEKM